MNRLCPCPTCPQYANDAVRILAIFNRPVAMHEEDFKKVTGRVSVPIACANTPSKGPIHPRWAKFSQACDFSPRLANH